MVSAAVALLRHAQPTLNVAALRQRLMDTADDLGVAAKPVLMSIVVASAAAFLTPIATPANMMVLGPGGYRFGDYWRLGLVMLGLFFVVAVGLVPLIWPF